MHQSREPALHPPGCLKADRSARSHTISPSYSINFSALIVANNATIARVKHGHTSGQSTGRAADLRRHNLALWALVRVLPRCIKGVYSCSQLSPQTRYWCGSYGDSLWPSVGCSVLGSWNGCSEWCGAGDLQQGAGFEDQRPDFAVTRPGRPSSERSGVFGGKYPTHPYWRSSRWARPNLYRKDGSRDII